MGRNGARPQATSTTKERVNSVSERKRRESKRKEDKLIQIATDLAIELYAPALKELAKH